jgi:protein-S-isoprenylcysteine O-methyltransferase Ste14
MAVLTILCIACFPVNPLVLTGLLKPGYYLPLFILGAVILYWSTREEERRLIAQFGSDYQAYMQRVPRMNLILGVVRLYRRQKGR